MNIATKNTKAAAFVQRASDLARAIEPSLRRETQPIGVTPDELVSQIKTAIEAENWPEAENRMLLWFNVLNSTEIVKTDRRRASPHPLDRLSFDSLRRLSADVVESDPLGQAAGAITFSLHEIASAAGNVQVLQTIDFDLDLDADLVSVDDTGLMQLWSNDGSNAWSAAGQLQLEMQPRGLVVADLFLVDSSNPNRLRADRKPADGAEPDFGSAVRHNTFVSLVAFGSQGVKLIQIDGRGSADPASRMSWVSGESGLEEVTDVTAAVVGDLEADGDLDLVLATQTEGVRMFANRGNRTFFEVTPVENRFGRDDPVSAMAIADLDRDLDLDLVTTHAASGRVGMLENLLHLQFRGRYLDEIPKIDGLSAVAVEDIDGNVSWDLVLGGSGGSAIVFSQTADANAWTVDRVVSEDEASPDIIVADFDNDSWMELLAWGNAETRLTRIGPWGFGPWQPVDVGQGVTSLVAADFDRNGTVDLAAAWESQIACRPTAANRPVIMSMCDSRVSTITPAAA